MVSDYVVEHPMASPEKVLTDCLIATQSSPSSDDPDRMAHFRRAWQNILDGSRDEIERFLKADFELALQEGTYETVAALYAADFSRWTRGTEARA
jgi:hypothetical protein